MTRLVCTIVAYTLFGIAWVIGKLFRFDVEMENLDAVSEADRRSAHLNSSVQARDGLVRANGELVDKRAEGGVHLAVDD